MLDAICGRRAETASRVSTASSRSSKKKRRGTHALVGQNRGTVDEELVLDGDVVSEDGDVLDAGLARRADKEEGARSVQDPRRLSVRKGDERRERTQRPTLEFQPMMELMIQACSLTFALAMMTHRCRRTPAPILQPGPMTTLGPMSAVGSTSAVCSGRARR